MAKRTGPTNLHLKKLIRELKKLSREKNVGIWRRIAVELSRATRQRRVVNLNRINKNCKDGETVVVPGKVLSVGELNKKVTVAAWQFSEKAKEKIKDNLTIEELMKRNPKGSKVRIIG